jgi:flagellar motility protein MotE (MotC chaperone)
MNKRTFYRIIGILTLAFVMMRLLQILIVCALVLIFVRLDRIYHISDEIFVKAPDAGGKKDPAPTPPLPAPAQPSVPVEIPRVVPASPTPAMGQLKKIDFPSESKSNEGFKVQNLYIWELSSEQFGDLTIRERSISEREATLQGIEQRLDQKTDELKKIQDSLKELLVQKDEKEKESLKKLVVVYEKMKPVEAAKILQGLGLETLLNIMDEMKDVKVSAIMAKMEPELAQILTIELAQRRQNLEARMKEEHDEASQPPVQQPSFQPADLALPYEQAADGPNAEAF